MKRKLLKNGIKYFIPLFFGFIVPLSLAAQVTVKGKVTDSQNN
jgi:hypothetical protein